MTTSSTWSSVPPHDRDRLVQLCRCVMRPPLATACLRWFDSDALSLTP